jgi:putative intracellular protease/amidase
MDEITIAVLLYDRLTALDAVGPYEVLSRLPGATVTFVAETAGPKRTDTGALALTADAALSEVADPTVVLVPGGPGQSALMDDGPVHEWLRAAHEGSTWTTSVCTGSLILGAAGLLRGVRATTHWLALDQLAALGATPVEERVVVDGKVVTAAGVSAGIDMGLTLAAEIAGPEVAQTIQLGIEYDPRPPFNAGSPSCAPSFAVDFLRSQSRHVLQGG